MTEAEGQIKVQLQNVLNGFWNAHPLNKGEILVVGCSSSEVCGGLIGHASNGDIGKLIYETINDFAKEHEIYIAAQCCEHLNRALVISRECCYKYGYEEVCVVPWLKGGGSFATASYHTLSDPVVVEHVKAHGGIDIGGTLIGMHLKDVAVPLRLDVKNVGKANITCAYTRPKLIGGERARYE